MNRKRNWLNKLLEERNYLIEMKSMLSNKKEFVNHIQNQLELEQS